VKRAEIFAGLLLLAFALVMIFLVVPAQTEVADETSIQPKTYPLIALWIIAALSALLVVLAVLALRAGPDSASPIRLENIKSLVLVGIIIAAAYVAIDWIGYIVGGVGLVAALMWYMGVRRPIPLIAVPVCAPVTVWLIFEVLLERPLP